MTEYKCKACLIDSSNSKLQKKKEVLLEFIFAEQSLCLTVSAQNVNIVAYTISRESMTSIVATNDLLAINFKTRNQIKISSLTKDKIQQLKHLLDALLVDDFESKSIRFLFSNDVLCFLSLSNEFSRIFSFIINEIEFSD